MNIKIGEFMEVLSILKQHTAKREAKVYTSLILNNKQQNAQDGEMHSV